MFWLHKVCIYFFYLIIINTIGINREYLSIKLRWVILVIRLFLINKFFTFLIRTSSIFKLWIFYLINNDIPFTWSLSFIQEWIIFFCWKISSVIYNAIISTWSITQNPKLSMIWALIIKFMNCLYILRRLEIMSLLTPLWSLHLLLLIMKILYYKIFNLTSWLLIVCRIQFL